MKTRGLKCLECNRDAVSKEGWCRVCLRRHLKEKFPDPPGAFARTIPQAFGMDNFGRRVAGFKNYAIRDPI